MVVGGPGPVCNVPTAHPVFTAMTRWLNSFGRNYFHDIKKLRSTWHLILTCSFNLSFALGDAEVFQCMFIYEMDLSWITFHENDEKKNQMLCPVCWKSTECSRESVDFSKTPQCRRYHGRSTQRYCKGTMHKTRCYITHYVAESELWLNCKCSLICFYPHYYFISDATVHVYHYYQMAEFSQQLFVQFI
jgi:hypothetical protein